MMNLYEQAICYFALAHPVIADIDGWYIPIHMGNSDQRALPFVLEFWKVFPEMRKNGMVEVIEKWPTTMYSTSRDCLHKALEIYKKHGYKATWLIPGCVGLERWKQ